MVDLAPNTEPGISILVQHCWDSLLFDKVASPIYQSPATRQCSFLVIASPPPIILSPIGLSPIILAPISLSPISLSTATPTAVRQLAIYKPSGVCRRHQCVF